MRSNRPNKRSSIPPITGIGGTQERIAGKLPTGSLHPSKTPAGGQQSHGGRQAIGTSGIRGVRMGTIPGRTSERTSTDHSGNAHLEEAHSPAHQERPSNPVRSPPLSSMMGFTMTSRDISKLRSRYEAVLHDRSLTFGRFLAIGPFSYQDEDFVVFCLPFRTTEDMKFRLRKLAITEGIPSDSVSTSNDGVYRRHQLTLRGRIWLLLLDVEQIDPQLYFELVEQGPSHRAHFIEQDAVRTFASDEAFQSLVKRPKIIRLLNSFSHWCRAISKISSENAPIVNTGYVQGMNRLAAPLLMALPEVPAFSCLCNLLTQHIPRWFEGGVLGVTDGCDLVDECLNVVDPELRNHLIGQNPTYTRQGFAFSRILSLYACCEPSTQVLQVWDALLSFGVHLVVLLCAAEAILKRDEILASDRNAVSLLNTQNCPLNASALINGAMEILPSLPPRLYKRVIGFPFVAPDQVARRSEKRNTDASRRYNMGAYTSQFYSKDQEEDWVKPVSSATQKRLERKAQEKQRRSQSTTRSLSSSRHEPDIAAYSNAQQHFRGRNPPPPPPGRDASRDRYGESDAKPAVDVEACSGDENIGQNDAFRKVAENAQNKLRQKLDHQRSSSTPRGRAYSGELLDSSRAPSSNTAGKNSFRTFQPRTASKDYEALSKSSIFSPIIVDKAKQASSPLTARRSLKSKKGS